MPTPRPLLLYSVNTSLAYNVAEVYYKGKHFAWCSPCFDARGVPSYKLTNPPTSNPCEILQGLAQEVRRNDRHSKKIEDNRLGIKRGADLHLEAGTITRAKRDEVVEIVDRALVAEFRPLLYVIPYATVARLVREVGVEERAHPLSEEYVIAALPRRKFDVIDFYGY